MSISQTSYTFAGATTTIYYMDAGDMIPRHRHLVDHLLAVLDGSVQVTVFDARSVPRAMTPQSAPLTLPAHIDHEFQATANGTELISMISAPSQPSVTGIAGVSGQAGGIALDDGTVVQGAVHAPTN